GAASDRGHHDRGGEREHEHGHDELEEREAPVGGAAPDGASRRIPRRRRREPAAGRGAGPRRFRIYFVSHDVTSAFSPSPPGALSAPYVQRPSSPCCAGPQAYWE